MDNPVLVEVMRGDTVESLHRGAIAVVDYNNKIVLEFGDINRPIFPRSAIKAFQAIPLFETGAVDRFDLTDQEIAMACASHNGEEAHANASLTMLKKCGLDVSSLECGVQWPADDQAQHPLIKAGLKPTALHNNCSGKHAGFVCVACAAGDDPKGYVKTSHPTMRMVRQAIEDMTGFKLAAAATGTDGCSIPTYAMPLRALAHGFARLATGQGLGKQRASAAERIRKAVANEPFFVAGTGRFDTKVMEILRERAFIKTGAEGVYCAALPETGIGVALKCDDGNGRASQIMMAAILSRFVQMTDIEKAALQPQFQPILKNWNGIEVGTIRPVQLIAG
jgi:L-asparaginase II